VCIWPFKCNKPLILVLATHKLLETERNENFGMTQFYYTTTKIAFRVSYVLQRLCNYAISLSLHMHRNVQCPEISVGFGKFITIDVELYLF